MPAGKTYIERAIYQNVGDQKYVVIGSHTGKGGGYVLASFDKLMDAQIYRDNRIKNIAYGKGIIKEKNGRYSARIICSPSTLKVRNMKNSTKCIYIGTFDTPDEARAARLAYIESLK